MDNADWVGGRGQTKKLSQKDDASGKWETTKETRMRLFDSADHTVRDRSLLRYSGVLVSVFDFL